MPYYIDYLKSLNAILLRFFFYLGRVEKDGALEPEARNDNNQAVLTHLYIHTDTHRHTDTKRHTHTYMYVHTHI